jgi:hypothetical protein
MYDISSDPEALRKSLDRAQVCLNAYTWLLEVVPKPEETMALANKASLASLVYSWKGCWTMYADYTAEIAPFESSFVNHRRFFANLGLDMSKVPYMVLQQNRLDIPEIISNADAKERYGQAEAPNQPSPMMLDVNSDMATNLVMLGAGAAAVVLGTMFLRKRRTVGMRDAWNVNGKRYFSYGEAQTELTRLRAQGKHASIKRSSRRFSGIY